MHKQALQIYTLALGAFFTIAVLGSYSERDQPVAPLTQADQEIIPQIIKPVSLDREFVFAGEALPMDNPDVLERLDQELTLNAYRHGNTLLNMKKAHRYFPMIERILAENNIPEDMKYLAVAESDLKNATSPVGARGFWQFMKETGRYYGLEITSEVDERYHLEKATQAACKYLQGYYKRFGSWTLAAAAYNMGGTRLARELKAQQGESYFDLNLNQETMRYVFRVIAIKTILEDPQTFGFYVEDADKYQELGNYREVEIGAPILDLGSFAKEHQTTYRQIKLWNPWLRTNKLSASNTKKYTIRLPKEK